MLFYPQKTKRNEQKQEPHPHNNFLLLSLLHDWRQNLVPCMLF